MTTAAIIVLAVRLLFPLSIFRWRIGGSVGAMLLDGVDVILVDAWHLFWVKNLVSEIITSRSINGSTCTI